MVSYPIPIPQTGEIVMNNNEIDKQKLMDAVISSSGGAIDRNSLNEAVKDKNAAALINKLSEKDKEKLSRVMSDRKSMEEVLKSPQAQAILKSFLKGGGKNG